MNTKTIRLDKLLTNLGYGSRREVQHMIECGQLTHNDAAFTDPSQRIALNDAAMLLLAGEALDPLPPLTIMMHKPVGVVCSHQEAGRRIYDLLPPRWRQRDPALSSIGRLDKDTSGLLLLTDDGQFLHKIISPKHHVKKIYIADLAQPLRGHETALFASGTMMLEGETKPLLPAALHVLAPNKVQLTLMEGRYHQVRRMFAATDNHVVALHRCHIGGLELPADLPVGQIRVLTPAQRESIFVLV